MVRSESAYIEAERRLWKSFGLSPIERRVHLEHSDLAVRVQEVGNGPPILLIHGASNSGVSWAGLAARLPEFRCLMLDRPGTGLSDPISAPFESADELAHFHDTLVSDVLDGLGLSSASLIGTSYGGYAALRAAARSPERIDGMVILGWTMGAPNPDLPLFMTIASIPSVARLTTKLPVNERIVRSMFKRIGLRRALRSGRVSQEIIDCYVALLRHTDTLRNELEVGRWTMTWKGLSEEIVLAPSVLATIETPTYFLWGEEDPFGPPDAARRFVNSIPNAQLELVPGAGHAVWLDDPELTALVIRRHFTESSGLRS
jgi:2-hydroxy-6-oxonona-2,4-dienedioate hydrolase